MPKERGNTSLGFKDRGYFFFVRGTNQGSFMMDDRISSEKDAMTDSEQSPKESNIQRIHVHGD